MQLRLPNSNLVRYQQNLVKSVRYPYDIRTISAAYIPRTSVRDLYGVCTASVRRPYGICTAPVRDPAYIRYLGCTDPFPLLSTQAPALTQHSKKKPSPIYASIDNRRPRMAVCKSDKPNSNPVGSQMSWAQRPMNSAYRVPHTRVYMPMYKSLSFP